MPLATPKPPTLPKPQAPPPMPSKGWPSTPKPGPIPSMPSQGWPTTPKPQAWPTTNPAPAKPPINQYTFSLGGSPLGPVKPNAAPTTPVKYGPPAPAWATTPFGVQTHRYVTGALNVLNSNSAFQNALWDQQASQAGANMRLGQQGLQDQFYTDTGKLAEQELRNVQLQQQQLAADRAYNDQIYQSFLANQGTTGAYNQTQLNQALGYIGEQRGLSARDLSQQQNYANQAYGLTNKQLNLQSDVGKREASQEAAGRGATLSAGLQEKKGDIYKQLVLGIEGATTDRDKAMQQAQLGYDTDIAGYGYGEQQARLAYNRQQQQQEYEKQQNEASYAKQQKESGIRDQYLDSLSHEYGISNTAMKQALERGLSQLGMDYNSVITQISQNRVSGNANDQARALQLEQMILQLAQNG